MSTNKSYQRLKKLLTKRQSAAKARTTGKI
jgi:hypothetical protein